MGICKSCRLFIGYGNDSYLLGPQNITIKIPLDTGIRSRSGCVSGTVCFAGSFGSAVVANRCLLDWEALKEFSLFLGKLLVQHFSYLAL
jgi:hypothetical protein